MPASRLGQTLFAVGLSVWAVAAVSRDGAAACRSTCSEELRACRRECGELRGAERRGCRRRCSDASTCTAAGVRLRIVAYIVNECGQDAAGFSGREKLVVRRGNCDPVTLMELPPVGPVADPIGFCRIYGQFRIGGGSIAIGRFQRIGVTPDGSGIVFELTNDDSIYEPVTPEPPQEGIFFVHRDGSGLRRLGPQSAVPILTVVVDPTSSLGVSFGTTGASPVLAFSPNGALIAYEDLGPGPDGGETSQVFVTDVGTGERRQVTHLPPPLPGGRVTGNVFFVDDRTMLFWNGAEGATFMVKTDGSQLQPIPNVVAIAGATIVPEFGVVRRGTNVFPVHFPEKPRVTYSPDDDTRELFILDRTRALQLTKFGYPDTGIYSTLQGNRVFFATSADPRGENPQGICQLFSITPLGGNLRQLTHLPADAEEKRGCAVVAPDVACRVSGIVVDPVTSAVGFVSSCDPLGRNPNGEQFFAMRPDGTGLRQTTAFRGVEKVPDGGVRVEMAGPAAYSTLAR